ncbi:MAG: D-aminoacyl-tRNA deacylase [Actinobacteria bacterium]|nr:D-aminoacyl-tRNA deacylase [Actinomycetota bacterium]
MRSVIQRVCGASVSVEGEVVGALNGPGLVALVGVTHTDDLDVAQRMARKIYDLRIFDGDNGEVSARDTGLPILVVSQFTLYADTKKGRRPTWDAAAPRAVAEPLIDTLIAELRAEGATVSTGVFGADMQVSLVNDGPITILLEI